MGFLVAVVAIPFIVGTLVQTLEAVASVLLVLALLLLVLLIAWLFFKL